MCMIGCWTTAPPKSLIEKGLELIIGLAMVKTKCYMALHSCYIWARCSMVFEQK